MLAPRKLLLGAALAATLVASWVDFEPPEPPESVRPAGPGLARAPAGVAVPAPPPVAGAQHPVRGRFESSEVDVFASRSWQPPPPPPPKAQAPTAPPLPFRYLGKLLEEDAVMVFLAQGARTHLAHKGDVLMDYKVEEITPARMTLVYLPLNEKQYLTFGSEN